MMDFIRNCIEYQNWGYNDLTFYFLCTILFTIIQAYGLIQQGKQIFHKKSTETLSLVFFAYSAYYFFAFIVFGLYEFRLAAIFNGLLGLVYIPILIGFAKYGKEKLRYKITVHVLAFLILAMILIENKDAVLAIGLGGIIVFMLIQLRQMRVARSRGAVNIQFLVVFFLTGIFWLGYSVSSDQYVLAIFNSCSLLIYLAMIWLYWKYGPKKILRI